MARLIALALEAATYAGSVALLDGGRLLGERSVAMRGREREALLPAVAELLAAHAVVPDTIGRVICGAGPGSFTSLRIAGGIAKGIAMAAGAPLVPVSSLALLVASQIRLPAGRYLAAIDALRGEYYLELFEVGREGEIERLSPATVVPSGAVAGIATERHARVVGLTGASEFVAQPRASAATSLMPMIDAAVPADLGSWEPSYGRLAEAQVKWETAHGRPLVEP